MILLALQIYAIIGAVVAAAFLTVGIGRVSPDAQGSYAFRPLIVPGVVLLWPLVLVRWFQLERGPPSTPSAPTPPKRLQDRTIMVMTVAVPVILFGAMLAMQTGQADAPAVLLAPANDAAQKASP